MDYYYLLAMIIITVNSWLL